MAAMVITDSEGREIVKDERVGVHEHVCGSQFFYLNEDGTVNCGVCDKPVSSIRWLRARVN